MRIIRSCAFAVAVLAMLAMGQGVLAAENRIALVVGESAYPSKPLATAANDAGLIAQTLQAAGFDVTGARDLEETALKQSFRDFLDKAAASGPDTVAVVYFAGYGLQLEGENYLVPIDAKIARDADIPMRALRVSDYLKPLAAAGAKLSVVVLDAARANPFQMQGQPLAGGLALYEPGAKALLAFNAAPGTIAPQEQGPYGAYAHALAEMIRDGGTPLMEVFDKTRLRVADATKGAQIPWNSSKIDTDFLFFQRTAEAPARAAEADAQRFDKPISALGPDDGYTAAIRRDTLQGYQDYVASYPSAPSAKRVRAMLAARREALTWRRTRVVDTPNGYWSYLRRYPKGPHAWDARRRLAELSQALEPPPRFETIEYDYEPPPAEEIIYVERPVVIYDDPSWGFAPPPPPPVYILPPPPPNFVVLPPPVIIAQPYVLPAPNYVPIPVWQRPPPHVAPPPDNFIYANVHNSIDVDPRANNVVVRNHEGQVLSTGALTAVGAGAAAVAGAAAIPHFLPRRPPAVAPVAGVVAPSPAGASDGALRPGVPPLRGVGPDGVQPAGQPGAPSAVPGGAPVQVEGRPTPPDMPAGASPKDRPLARPPVGAPVTPGTPLPGPGGAQDHALPKPGSGVSDGAPPPGRGRPAPLTPPGGPDAGAPEKRPAGPGATQDHALPKPALDAPEPVRARPLRERPDRGGRGRPQADPDGLGAPEGAPISPRPQAAPRRPRNGPSEMNDRPPPPRGMDGDPGETPRRMAPRPREPMDAPPQMREAPRRMRDAPMGEPGMRDGPPPMPQRMREGPPPMQPRMREAPPPRMERERPPEGMMRPPPMAPRAAPPPQAAPMMNAPPRQMMGPSGGGRGPRGPGPGGAME